MLKHGIVKLFHYGYEAPLEFWCYALEYLALGRGVLARTSLGWRPYEELLYGETMDITVFRFPDFVQSGFMIQCYLSLIIKCFLATFSILHPMLVMHSATSLLLQKS